MVFFVFIACKEGPTEKSKRTALPYYNDARFTPKWLESDNIDLNEFHRIPDFNLINQEGNSISQEDFKEKIYVADFIFTTCPGICPKMTSNMAKVQEAFKADEEVLILSHSVTPEMDSVAVLKQYAEKNGVISGKWHLATGDRDHIYDLGRSFYFVEEDLGELRTADDFLHTENFVLIDKKRHIRGIYNGINATSVQQLIDDIARLKLEL